MLIILSFRWYAFWQLDFNYGSVVFYKLQIWCAHVCLPIFWCNVQVGGILVQKADNAAFLLFTGARWERWWQGIATALRCSLMTAATQSYKWVHFMHSVSTQMNAQSWSHWKCSVVCGGMVWVDLLMRWQWQRSAVAGYRWWCSLLLLLCCYITTLRKAIYAPCDGLQYFVLYCFSWCCHSELPVKSPHYYSHLSLFPSTSPAYTMCASIRCTVTLILTHCGPAGLGVGWNYAKYMTVNGTVWYYMALRQIYDS